MCLLRQSLAAPGRDHMDHLGEVVHYELDLKLFDDISSNHYDGSTDDDDDDDDDNKDNNDNNNYYKPP